MYPCFRFGAPAPYEVIVWQVVEATGWTLEYVEGLPLKRLHEWLLIRTLRARADNNRRGK